MLIDLSGYSFSGKSALYDILDSTNTLGGFGFDNEFELLRVNGGLYDFVVAVSSTPWSPLRSDAGVRNFKKLSHNLGGSRSSLKDRFFRLGTYYDDLFPGYTKEVDSFIDSIVNASWKGSWLFPIFLSSSSHIALEKIFLKLGKTKYNQIYLSRLDTEHIYKLSRSFIDSLIISASKKLNVKHVLLNNTFEPSANDDLYNLVGECLPIVVDRDPRDIYISAWLKSKGAGEVGSVALGGNIEQFIERFLIFRKATNPNKKVVFMQFEDIIQDFDYLYKKLSPLNLDRENLYEAWTKIAKVSSQNIGLWKKDVPKEIQQDIKLITENLSIYCIN